ncbi:uncharacterized protein isoform X4 [Rhodnius prolixus]|uniref:uncharacterized protein isoform X4 n=1 Tax=Rhodnius prolixus TaxID=13249 RepID=UPI003D18E88D
MYFNEKEITNLGLHNSLAALVIFNIMMLTRWHMKACIQLLDADAFMLLVLEVLVLVASISFIATLGTALISGWELTPLLLMAIPVKIIGQRW